MKYKTLEGLAALFNSMDEDRSGLLSWEEVKNALQQDDVRQYFACLGLDFDDIRRVFRLCDDDESGEVSAAEFLEGCTHLRGAAKSLDVYDILLECRKINQRFEDI